MYLGTLLIFTASLVLCNEAAEGNILVQFDFVEPLSWNGPVRHTFKKVIANYTNQYCLLNFSACSMDTHKNFSADNVQIEAGYPQLYDISTLVSFYVQLPQSTANHLPRDILAEIVQDRRIEIQTSLKAVSHKTHLIAFRISHVNSVYLLPPYDETLNKIMIPITLIILLSLALFIATCEIKRSLLKKAELKEIERRLIKEKAVNVEEKQDNVTIFQATSDNQEISA